MTLDQRFRLLVFLQVLLGILAFCMAQQNPGLMLVVGAIASASWYVTEGPQARFLPRWLVNLGSLLAMGWLLLASLVHQEALPLAMGHFIMVLQVLMLYARKTSREYSMVLVLSLLQIIGASVLSVSLLYGLFLLAYCGLSLVTLMLLQLKATGDWVADQRRYAAPHGTAISTSSPTPGRGARRDFVRSWSLIGTVTLVSAVLAFVTIPRSAMMPTPALENLTDPRRKTTAFSQTVDLTGGAPSEGSTASVMHMVIRFADQPAGSEQEPWLLRGAVLDHYNPHRMTWTRSGAQARHDLLIDPQTLQEYPLLPVELPRTSLTASITLRQTGPRVLFVPVRDEAPLLPLASVDSVGSHGLSINPFDGQVMLGDNLSPPLTYDLSFARADLAQTRESYQRIGRSAVGVVPEEPSRNWSRLGYRRDFRGLPPEDEPAGYDPLKHAGDWVRDFSRRSAQRLNRSLEDLENYALNLPPQTLLIRQFTLQTLRERGLEPPSPDAAPAARLRIVQALTDHLQTRFDYSDTNPAPPAGQDPVTTFLYQQQEGHCELFASALTLMCRSLNMPARVITGYRAAEFNTVGKYYVVRESHAHAWSEVDLGGDLGWVTFDPTPTDGVNEQHDVSPGWWPLAWLQDVYQHVEYTWLRSVIAYDHRSRQQVLDSVGNQFRVPDLDGQGWVASTLRWIKQVYSRVTLDPMMSFFVGGVLLTLAIALGSLALQLARRRRRLQQLQLTQLPRSRSRKLARRLHFYLYMLELLERHGHRRPAWQTPGDFARELADANPLKFELVVALTDLFYQVRFGHTELDNTHHDRIDAHLRQLERGLTEKR